MKSIFRTPSNSACLKRWETTRPTCNFQSWCFFNNPPEQGRRRAPGPCAAESRAGLPAAVSRSAGPTHALGPGTGQHMSHRHVQGDTEAGTTRRQQRRGENAFCSLAIKFAWFFGHCTAKNKNISLKFCTPIFGTFSLLYIPFYNLKNFDFIGIFF